MRLIVGLDRPQKGTATINGKAYRDLPDPLRTVGALLEAKAVHTGRSARNHLLFLAQSQGLPVSRVDEMLDFVGLKEVADKRAGGFSLGMGQRLGIAAALLGDPKVLLLDEPVNGLDPEGVLWIRNLLKQLASQGRTVLVSSHLMNEMAVTADHLIVIGRGRLITAESTAEVISRGTEKSVRVLTPDAAKLTDLITADGGEVKFGSLIPADAELADGADLLIVTGLNARRVGELASSGSVVLHGRADAATSVARGGVHGADGRKPGIWRAQWRCHWRQRRRWRAEGGCPMTTASSAAIGSLPAAGSARSPVARFAGLLAAEWTKIRSVRSTVWTLILFVVLTVGLTAGLTAIIVANWNGPRAARRGTRRIILDPVGSSCFSARASALVS